MDNYFIGLECTYCDKTYSGDKPIRTCHNCDKVLYPQYDLDKARKHLDRSKFSSRIASMWRYFEIMPVQNESNIVSLGEGFTPLLEANRLAESIGMSKLLIKDEGLNPTASFKARGLSAAVSKAKELGLTKLTMPSAGNAGGALAAYASKAGMEAHIFMPNDAPEANRIEVEFAGANLTLVDGLISDAGIISKEKARKEGLFDVSTLQEPYRVEGKKTMGYELAEQLDWKLPDAIIYPTGGGTGIVGFWKSFQEMECMDWIDTKRPRMYSVQSEGCAPIVRAFNRGDEFAEPWENANTIASGMRVPKAIGDYLMLRVLKESRGGGVTVSDEEILSSVREIFVKEGIFACPEGAATLSALKKLLESGTILPHETVLLLNTGSSIKYLDVLV